MMICGVDEAGRGCLAGSLYMAGVILHHDIEGLKDSKKLSRQQRFALEQQIKQTSQSIVIAFDAQKIDQDGLSACLKEGLQTIATQLHAHQYIFDGNTNFGVSQYATLIKGDDQMAQIKAASILAKCAKDREMMAYHNIYPQYGFIKHCGYGTKQHIQAISQYGYLPIHRKSFTIKAIHSPNTLII